MKKFLSLLLVMLLCFTLSSPCNTYAAAINLNKTNLSLNVGKSYTLKLSGTSDTIKWSSSKDAVAKVSTKGKVTAIAKGKATITATVKSKKYQCSVTVNDPKVELIFSVITFDDIAIEDYIKDLKKENPEYLEVKVYDDDHYLVTMYESDRQKLLKEANYHTDELLTAFTTDESFGGAFTKVEADKLLSEVILYADSSKYEDLLSVFGVSLALAFVSDYVQALNFIDIKDRTCNITIYDKDTGDLLYPVE